MGDLRSHLEHQSVDFLKFFWHRLRFDAICGPINRLCPTEILDCGAGAGFLGDYLAQSNPKIRYHFDEPIPSLRESLIARFGADRELRPPADLSRIQMVFLLDVIEHIEHDGAFLKDLYSRLPSGAVVVITVPALMVLWSSWDTALGHFRRYTKSHLRRTLEAAGFAEVEVSYLFPEMVVPGLIRKVKREITGAQNQEASSEFPILSKSVNEGLYQLGRISQRLFGRYAPIGSSLMAVSRKS